MPPAKLKTLKSAAKRFKPTGSGLKRRQANKRHNLSGRTTKNKRQLRGTIPMASSDEARATRMLRRS